MNGGGVSAPQSGRLKTIKDEWRQEDCLSLLERIRSLLPDGDAMKYKTTESHFDWDKVGFGNFTGEMCRQKWSKVSTEVRKYRTMTELITDAIEFVKNPYKGKKLKTHPDFPKKPLTPYFRFFMEKRAKYAKIHPEMSNLDLTKILSKKYKELPDKKKQKYVAEFQSEKEAFEKNMARFKRDHPELMEAGKKSDLPEKPKTPQQLWYNHEKKTYMKVHPQVSQKELKEVLRRQWSQLSDKKRLKWIGKALELQKDYEDSMRAYHEAHPDASADDHVRSVLTKAERQLKDKFDGRPTKPPPNGYSLYCAELMVNMKDVPSTERMVLCSKRWKMMTQKEKDMFQKRCEQRKKQYDMDLHRFLERELSERRPSQKKAKFDGEPKKPPVSGYQMFSQELLTNGELNHFSLKERMVEIGKRWHTLTASQKDAYKKHVDATQARYRVLLDAWLKSLSPQDRAAYKEFSSSVQKFQFCLVRPKDILPEALWLVGKQFGEFHYGFLKRRSTSKAGSGPAPKMLVTAKGKAAASKVAPPAAAKRAMAYRAKQDVVSDSNDDKSDSSDSDDDDEEDEDTSGSCDSEDDDDEEEHDDDDDDEDQTSSDRSSDSD
ncbi:upstream binding transcription factor, like isoform X10 [Phyllopteryx taeniolatus]|uniref:upstream binding transcription factor, like isoform X10 n=1 Tax=Phyllopteryx taeniolatus TaxID=161469 RepID=UPI002AD579FB|nr:upstream binding transcription factor, like isoform X10 [Phyllopteryx taeniolatus]